MPFENPITGVVFQGLGVAGQVLGNPYSQFRVNANTTGSLNGSSSLVTANFKTVFERTIERKILRNTTFDLQAYEMKADGAKLQVGDVFQRNSNTSEKYCVADIIDQKPYRIIAMRVEMNCSVSRPRGSAGEANQQPTSGVTSVLSTQGYAGVSPDQRYYLTLDAGLAQMLPYGQGTSATIPIGFQPLNRVRDGKGLGVPTEFPQSNFLCFMPALDGYSPQVLDVIKNQQAESFLIRQVYSSGDTGIVGNIMQVELLPT